MTDNEKRAHDLAIVVMQQRQFAEYPEGLKLSCEKFAADYDSYYELFKEHFECRDESDNS